MRQGVRVDVLIPVFNGERYLEEAVCSILRQTHRELSVVAVDDGSTDRTAAILGRLAARDARIRILSRANGGIVEALNSGLAQCSADFVARHDADDIAYPERLAQQLDSFYAQPDLVAVAGSGRHIDQDGRPLGTVARFPDPTASAPDAFPALEPYLLHPCLMFRRAAVVAVGGYRHVLHAEDTDLYWRLQERGGLSNDPRLQCDYRMHDASISSGSLANGRGMAVSSQLSALSALRRRAGREHDIIFNREAAAALKVAAAASLRDACTTAEEVLTTAEAAHLRVAASLKLLDLAGYRPFELELSDCRFIGDVFERALGGAPRQAQRRILRSWSASAVRLWTKGLRVEATALLRPPVRRAFYARAAAGFLMPPGLYKWLGDIRHGRKG